MIKENTINKYIFGGGEIAESISSILKIPIEKDTDVVNNKIEELYITSGFLNREPFFQQTYEEIYKSIDANLIYPLKILTELKKYIDKNTKIILISSSSSYNDREGYSVYSSTKTALEIFAKTLYKEGYNIKLVRPARTDTKLRWDNISKADKENWENLLTPEDIVKQLPSFLKSDYNYLNIFKSEEQLITQLKDWEYE